METTRTYDTALIYNVITNEAIWKTISEDGHNPSVWSPDVFRDCWLEMSIDGETVGVFLLKALNSMMLEVHPHILPKFRGEIGMQAGIEHLRWVYDNFPNYRKIVCSVPTLYKNVKIYAMQLGYQEEGVNRLSFLKGGKIYDQWTLGITRDEIGDKYNL